MKRDVRFEGLEPRRMYAFGDYDTTFGANGLVSDGTTSTGQATVLTSGRIALNTGSAVKVFTAAGQLDTAFGGGDGVINIASAAIYATTGGKFFALGTASSGNGVLRRYNANGSLDTNYGVGGAATLPFATFDPSDAAPSVLVAPDGGAYVFTYNNGSSDGSSITHVTAAGQIDTGFGTAGVLTLPGEPASPSAANYSVFSVNNLKLASDGSLLAAGTQSDFQPRFSSDGQVQVSPKLRARSAFLVRITTGGDIDRTFGSKGVYRISGGKQTLGGTVLALSARRALMVYSIDGRLQTVEVNANGGGRGRLRLSGERDFATASLFGSVAVPLRLPDGRVIVTTRNGATTLTRVRGYWQAGPIVGLTQLAVGSVTGTAIDSAGRLIVSGNQRATQTSGTQYQLGRIDLTGEPSGYLAGQFGAGTENDVAVRPDGSVDLVYYDAKRQSLRYARRNPAGRWGRPETIRSSLAAGVQLDLNVNSRGVPYVAYYDAGDKSVQLGARLSSGLWSFGSVDVKAGTASGGVTPSLEFSTRDDPYVAFYNRTLGELRLYYPTYDDGGGTALQTVDRFAATGTAIDLAIDPVRGTFAIAYAGPKNTVRLAERNRSGWKISTAATTKAGVGDLTLGFDNLTNPGQRSALTRQAATISYYDADRADLVIARRPAPGKAFSSTRVATAGRTGLYPQFQIGSYVQRTVFWDRTRDEVRYGYDLSRDPTTNNATLLGLENGSPLAADIPVTGGGRYLSVAAVSAERPSPSVFAYVKTASGELVVRDA